MKPVIATLDQDKLGLILEAAQKRFGHYGIAKTTMSEIAEDVGLSKASLYYYYPDKEHLFIAVIQKEMDEFLKVIRKIILEEGIASKKVKQYVSIRHDTFRKFISIARIGLQSLTAMKPSMDQFKENFTRHEKELIQTILHQGVRNGEFNSMNVTSTADLFVTTLQGLRMLLIKKGEIISEQDYQTLEHYHKQLTVFFLKAITKQK